MAEPGGGGRYARTLERELSRVRGRPTILSPRDWALVQDWRRRGIPLGLVLDLLREAAERSRRQPGSSVPKSLAYLAPAVEESWRTVEAGRRHERPAAAPADVPEGPAAQWRRVAAAGSTPRALREALAGLLAARADGGNGAELDAELDRALIELNAAEADEARARGAARLAPFRGRMSRDAFERTLDRAVADELRERWRLPRLEGEGISH